MLIYVLIFCLYRVMYLYHVLNIAQNFFCLFDMLSLVGINIRSWFYVTDGLKSFGIKNPRHRSTLVKIADVRNLIEYEKSLVFC